MEVSTEALRQVKEALKTFKTDIEGIGARTFSRNQVCMQECQQRIIDTTTIVKELEGKVEQLKRKIQEIEERLVSMQNELQQLKQLLPRLEQALESNYQQLDSLLRRLEILQAQLADAEDENEQRQIQQQIDLVQNQINSVRRVIRDTEQRIAQVKERKETLEKSIGEFSIQKNECENELSIQKKRCNQYQQKLEKMTNARKNISTDFNEYIQKVQKFEMNTTESAETKFKAVDECIGLIEEIESIM